MELQFAVDHPVAWRSWAPKRGNHAGSRRGNLLKPPDTIAACQQSAHQNRRRNQDRHNAQASGASPREEGEGLHRARARSKGTGPQTHWGHRRCDNEIVRRAKDACEFARNCEPRLPNVDAGGGPNGLETRQSARRNQYPVGGIAPINSKRPYARAKYPGIQVPDAVGGAKCIGGIKRPMRRKTAACTFPILSIRAACSEKG